MRPAIFLDRDGTLIEDTGYPNNPDTVALLPGVAEALHTLRKKNYALYLVSNQSGVGRGIISQAQFAAVHEKFTSLLKGEGILLDGFSYCFHHPDENCFCRKPRTGNIPKTIQNVPIVFPRSYVVGDREADILLAKNLGCISALVLTGYGKKTLIELAEKQTTPQYAQFENLMEFAATVPELERILKLVP